MKKIKGFFNLKSRKYIYISLSPAKLTDHTTSEDGQSIKINIQTKVRAQINRLTQLHVISCPKIN